MHKGNKDGQADFASLPCQILGKLLQIDYLPPLWSPPTVDGLLKLIARDVITLGSSTAEIVAETEFDGAPRPGDFRNVVVDCVNKR